MASFQTVLLLLVLNTVTKLAKKARTQLRIERNAARPRIANINKKADNVFNACIVVSLFRGAQESSHGLTSKDTCFVSCRMVTQTR